MVGRTGPGTKAADGSPTALPVVVDLRQGEACAGLGDLDGARQLHEQALAGRWRVLGDDHPDTLESMNILAVVRRELGEL